VDNTARAGGDCGWWHNVRRFLFQRVNVCSQIRIRKQSYAAAVTGVAAGSRNDDATCRRRTRPSGRSPSGPHLVLGRELHSFCHWASCLFALTRKASTAPWQKAHPGSRISMNRARSPCLCCAAVWTDPAYGHPICIFQPGPWTPLGSRPATSGRFETREWE